jgi:hypothetical protein
MAPAWTGSLQEDGMKKTMCSGDRGSCKEPRRAARILVGVLPSLLLAAYAYAAHAPRVDAAAPPEATAAPTRFLLRPLAGKEAAGERLGEATASMGLHVEKAFESGCKMVEAPAGVTLTALRDRLGTAFEVEPNHTYHVASASPPPATDVLYTQDQQAVMSAINAPAAWGLTMGYHEEKNVIAVLDTGADYTNPDLVGAIHYNVLGWLGQQYPGNLYGMDVYDGTGDPMDYNGHGTAVASIIGAQGLNGTGLVGVAPNSRLLVLKCFDDHGETNDATLISCYELITNANTTGLYNIRVANNSWGGMPSSSCLQQAISDAGDAGILSVFAAGSHSEGQDLDVSPEYPAASGLPTTITVASATLAGDLSPDSNWGLNTVDLAAPGVNITTLGRCQTGATSCTTLEQGSGTSFAAPFVTGAAALLFALNPALTPAEAKTILLSNVTPYPQLSRRVGSGGLLNVYAALTNTPPSGPPALPPPPVNGIAGTETPTPFVDGTYTVDVAEFPTSPQDSPPITPGVGFLFVRTVAGVQEQRWLLQGWNGHYFLRPPRQSMGMTVHPALLNYTDVDGNPDVVVDLPSWIAFAAPLFVASGPARSTYAMLAATVAGYDGQPLAPPFDYPGFIGPEPPATAALAQLDYFNAFPVLTSDPVSNVPVLSGFGYAVSEGPYQGREHWVLAPGVSGAVVVGSNGAPLGLSDFAAQMSAPAWQAGSTLVLGSVRYFPYFVAE